MFLKVKFLINWSHHYPIINVLWFLLRSFLKFLFLTYTDSSILGLWLSQWLWNLIDRFTLLRWLFSKSFIFKTIILFFRLLLVFDNLRLLKVSYSCYWSLNWNLKLKIHWSILILVNCIPKIWKIKCLNIFIRNHLNFMNIDDYLINFI